MSVIPRHHDPDHPEETEEHLNDPRALTDGVDLASCICTKSHIKDAVPIDPTCPVHNMILEDQ